jgi:hypothetical protein
MAYLSIGDACMSTEQRFTAPPKPIHAKSNVETIGKKAKELIRIVLKKANDF